MTFSFGIRIKISQRPSFSGVPSDRQLCQCLTAAWGETNYAELAEALGTSEGAARVAVHRLRMRYRAVIRYKLLNQGKQLEAMIEAAVGRTPEK